MNSFNAIDPAKNLASVSIRIFQGFCVLLFCLSIYLGYLAYLDLFPDWHIVHELSDGEIHWSGNSSFWQTLFFAIPALISTIAFFLLAYLGKVIRKE
jgi:ABC-type Fe3+ transport system permease subunit